MCVYVGYQLNIVAMRLPGRILGSLVGYVWMGDSSIEAVSRAELSKRGRGCVGSLSKWRCTHIRGALSQLIAVVHVSDTRVFERTRGCMHRAALINGAFALMASSGIYNYNRRLGPR